ncbi:hypothetical protein AB6A40_002493 [Gnathostoma spinigerum]|uniref:Uncharacterized protein n=1 Tax=Gnathostoma spinigerum TaxID=75299 RepID=A0ABD6EEJ6_9BILA
MRMQQAKSFTALKAENYTYGTFVKNEKKSPEGRSKTHPPLGITRERPGISVKNLHVSTRTPVGNHLRDHSRLSNRSQNAKLGKAAKVFVDRTRGGNVKSIIGTSRLFKKVNSKKHQGLSQSSYPAVLRPFSKAVTPDDEESLEIWPGEIHDSILLKELEEYDEELEKTARRARAKPRMTSTTQKVPPYKRKQKSVIVPRLPSARSLRPTTKGETLIPLRAPVSVEPHMQSPLEQRFPSMDVDRLSYLPQTSFSPPAFPPNPFMLGTSLWQQLFGSFQNFPQTPFAATIPDYTKVH